MILNDLMIEYRIDDLFDFHKSTTTKEVVLSQINPNSIDLTLDSHIMKMKPNTCFDYGSDNTDKWESHYVDTNELMLFPNECVLCCSREYIKMPDDLCGQLFTKSTLGRMFVNHMMAGVIDAGFEGKITLEFKNDSPNIIFIPFGSRVVQLVYSELCEKAQQPYYMRKSRYNFAENCEPPKREVVYG